MNDRLPVVLGAPGRCAHGRRKRDCLLCAQAAIQKQEIEITRLRAEVEEATARGDRLREELYQTRQAVADTIDEAVENRTKALRAEVEQLREERREWFEKGALYLVEAGWCRHYPSDHVKEAAARRLAEENSP